MFLHGSRGILLMATFYVTDPTELSTAISSASGGDTIILADGDYGELVLGKDFSSTVTFQSENPLGASFSRLVVDNGSNMAFDGFDLQGSFAAKYSSGISLTNSVTTSGKFYIRSVDGLVIDHCTATGDQYGILLNSVQNFSVTNSYFGNVTEDVMRITGDSYNGLIENNYLIDTVAVKPTHPDLLQMFGANGYTPHDITIRGNVFYDDGTTGSVSAQGIFVSDPQAGGYKNILIEDNLINVNSPNSIYINGGQENVVVSNNTLMPNKGDGGAIIRLAEKSGMDNSGTIVEGNVAKLLVDETHASTIGDNYIYGRDYDLSSLFQGSNGSTWENFLPVEGSDIDFGSGYGALDRLFQLLSESPDSTTSIATPEPDSGASTTVVEPDSSTPITAAEPDSSASTSDPLSVYHLDTSYEMNGKESSITILEHDAALEIDTGSIGLTFNADTVRGTRGVLSIGAAGYDDDISVWVRDGKLILCVENDEGQQASISTTGIHANTDYDLMITFDEDKVQLWLDDTLVGETQFDLDLSGNSESLVLGGLNSSSSRGTTSRVSSFFDGTISDVSVYDHVLTPSEYAALEDVRHDQDVAAVTDVLVV